VVWNIGLDSIIDFHMQKNVLNDQSLLDVALQHLGDISAIFDLAQKNDISIADDLIPGMILEMPVKAKSKVVDYYSNNDYKPATAITRDQVNLITGEGIEFWYVEYDFVVQ